MKKNLIRILAVILVMSIIFCACAYGEEAKYTPGTYTATGTGYGGPIEVEAVISNNAIETIRILSDNETLGIGKVALEQLPAKIIEKQTLGIDAMSGATVTSVALLSIMEDIMTDAGADIDALKARTEKVGNDEVIRKECDVVVVGAGLSGLAAATGAMEQGAHVIILEKLAVTGGSAKASEAEFSVCQVPENAEHHLTEEVMTLDEAVERWMVKQNAESRRESIYPDIERLKMQFVESMYTIDWLESFGATFTPKFTVAERGMVVLQGDVPEIPEGRQAAKIMNKLIEATLASGAELMLETPAYELIMDGDTVIGVRATSPDGEVEVYAKNVILSCGGFNQNPEMIAEWVPERADAYNFTSPGNTGDGIRMAHEAGAAYTADFWLAPSWPAPTNEFYAANPNATVFQHINTPLEGVAESSYYRLMVNGKGERFMNESAHYSTQTMDMTYGIAPFYSIYSKLEGKALEIAESGIATGTVFKADTIEDLAKQAGLDPQVLCATVKRYDEMCAAGVDTDFGKTADYLTEPVGEVGPFFMIQMVTASAETMGGVQTNTNYEALREDGSVIDGLYVTGASTNKYYFNQAYFSGFNLTHCCTDGRIAGAHAATH